MFRKKRDDGFTLIELMIVIAVIGILAIVLVPRIGIVKTQAKETGLDNNVRLVQGYVESKINKWESKEVNQEDVVDQIVTAFTFSDPEKQLLNPITSNPSSAVEVADADTIAGQESVIVLTPHDVSNPPTIGATPTETIPNAEGSVVVSVTASAVDAPVTSVTIYAYGSNGKLLEEKTVTITP